MRIFRSRPLQFFLIISALMHAGIFWVWNNQIPNRQLPPTGALNLKLTARATTHIPPANIAPIPTPSIRTPSIQTARLPKTQVSESQTTQPHIVKFPPLKDNNQINAALKTNKAAHPQPLKNRSSSKPNQSISKSKIIPSSTADAPTKIASLTQSSSGRKPHYPRRAIKKLQQGLVTLNFTVQANGKAKDIHLIKSSGYYLLDRSVLKFVETEKFQPTLMDGTTINSKRQYRYQFELTQ